MLTGIDQSEMIADLLEKSDVLFETISVSVETRWKGVR